MAITPKKQNDRTRKRADEIGFILGKTVSDPSFQLNQNESIVTFL